MVSRLLLPIVTLGLVALATPAPSQSAVDWGPAGGALFAGMEMGPTPSTAVPEGGPIRLEPLDQPFADAIDETAGRYGLDPKLIHALVVVESAYQVSACSPAGACGLTQLMPGTAADLGVRDRFDPSENLDGGADYLTRQIRRFQDLRLALAAYNSGPERVARLGRIPNIAETRDYVATVIDCYLALAAGRGVRSSRECAPREKES